ncbi:PREDICTED: uncharacterized protein LOC109186638 [Ipomoea nil]|uniref:uncharacterized protein LOC109186638 n=1 Tax=Ipomoea nil TaxID=35883 RepID=UPI000901E0B0|nr:PREDICTED: uncharacterized protein LOC109186638 [Ipomoea nil]XP_019192257.1 PREDICTED: uncharacterized protein LOC109186638 [Ipomoea nil]XP_019192258.1 PREDICTED: uncharacterized protein LOC109186638 [Ipomoea nil]
MVAESWLRSLWKTTKKRGGGSSEKQIIGVLAFEVASLMSKMVHLWKSLCDKQVASLREEIKNSPGIKKLVSEDDAYIARLICSEMIENLGNVAIAVARLAKKCNDPLLRSFEQAFNDLLKIGIDPYGWHLSWKKMDRKVKKMERFVVINSNLYQEMESLADFAQTLQRMKCNEDADIISLVEYEKKVSWKQQEVKHLKEVSVWSRSYDYVVRLLARAVFTIYCRIGHVFGVNPVVGDQEMRDSKVLESDNIHRSQSVAYTQSSVHPAETSLSRFSSEPIESLITRSGPISRTPNISTFHSGPLRNSTSTESLAPGGHKAVNFHSGPLEMSKAKSSQTTKVNKSAFKWWHSGNLQGKNPVSKSNKLNGFPMSNSYINTNGGYSGPSGDPSGAKPVEGNSVYGHMPNFSSKKSLMNAPPETLGAAALALHYANVIIVIEKLVSSPHLIGHDARDDLYNMLPASIRTALRAKLKPYAKKLSSSVCDMALAEEWNEALTGILEWLAPLAHNMIRWQSERSFEHQNFVSRTNVLLVQTLYFANQPKIEATIAELLVGLNYIWRYGRELNAKAIEECASVRTFDEFLEE